jgi:ERCC4-related helicase
MTLEPPSGLRQNILRTYEALDIKDFDECTKARHETALAKLPQAIAFIKDALESTEKIIVFAHHRDVLEALHAAFEGSALHYGGLSDSA